MKSLALRLFAAVAIVAALPLAVASDGDTMEANGGPVDLVCPSAVVAKPAITNGKPPLIMSDLEMPPLDMLGSLARPVIRDQPPLDPSRIPQFSLRTGRHFALWGDSHVAAGPLPIQLAQAIRDRGESVGTSFLPPTMGRSNVRLPIRAYCIGQSWTTDLSYTAADQLQTGPALANRSTVAGDESYLWLDLRNADREPLLRGVQLVYRPTGEGAALDYSVNDEPEQHVILANSGNGSATQSAVLAIPGDAMLSTLRLRVSQGRLVLQGFILDYAKPPQVTLDVFGLPSSTARGWANADPAYLAQALHGVSYDAVILEYGTNEGNVAAFDRDKYVAALTRTLTNLRSVFPQASCVLVGPPDRGVLMKKSAPHTPLDILQYARIHQEIASVQADVGGRFGCSAWNWQDLMGGPGGSYGWAYNSPTLMGRDLTHLTPAGYRRTASALAKSLGWSN